jgi:hypothetical protein
METTPICPPDSSPPPKRSTPAGGKVRLLTSDSLDGRTRAKKAFDGIVAAITNDLGGRTELTEIERHLITSFAGSALMQQHLLARLLGGELIDPTEFANVASSMIRCGVRLGTARRTKDVTTLEEYEAAIYGTTARR